jgi:hypothetical protein
MPGKRPALVNHEIAQVRKVKHHTFRGKTYGIEVIHMQKTDIAYGDCDPPSVAGKKIRIDPDQHGRRLLQTLLDEATHACNWDLDNVAVDEMAETMSKFLWRCGYRITKKKK